MTGSASSNGNGIAFPYESVRKAAALYLDLGLALVPVPKRQKPPVLDGWPDLQVTKGNLHEYFPDDRSINLGMILRAATRIADVDLDCPEAVATGGRWLPKTNWVSGRAGNPRSHYWYRPVGTVPYQKFEDVDDTLLLELRAGDGYQTVAPPGTHESGDEVIWHAFDGHGTEIHAGELTARTGEVAALTLLVRHWPKVKGKRQSAFMALAGGLCRNCTVPQTEEFLAAIADLTGDEEARKRVHTVARTATKIEAGEKATGWPTLARLLGPRGRDVTALACQWLGLADPPGPWPELIPLLNPAPEVPPFPIEVLPPWLREWADATATALQVPVDLPATLGLAVCSAGVAQKVVAHPRPGWVEPVTTFWVTALPPSDRKTQTFSRAVAPVFELQDRLRNESAPARRDAEVTLKAIAKRLARLEDQYGKSEEADERQVLFDEIKRVRDELSAVMVPVVPLLLVDDETPDNLCKVLCEQGGRLLQASAEGTLFENIGRWSEKPSFDIYLKAYSGDPLSVGRVTRERTECRFPALTCAIAPQPAVIEALGGEPSLAGRGFQARWFYSLPKSKVGRRVIGPPSVPDAIRDGYKEGVFALWAMTAGTDEVGRPKAWRVEFETEANLIIRAFERELEPRLAEGEDLWPLHGWGGKAAGGAERIATVLQLAEAVGGEGQRLTPVPAAVAKRAVKLVRDYLVPHAQAAFGVLAADERTTRARRVVKWFTGHGLTRFSVRDANQAMKGSIRTVDELHSVLDLIKRHNYIRQLASDRRSGPGRPRSPVYEVNPEALDGKGTGDCNSGGSQSPGASDSGNSEQSTDGNGGHERDRSDREDDPQPKAPKPGKTSTSREPATTSIESQSGIEHSEQFETERTVPGPIPPGSAHEGSLAGEEPTSSHNARYSQNSLPPNRGPIEDFENTAQITAAGAVGADRPVLPEGTAGAAHNPRNPQNRTNAGDSAVIPTSASAVSNPNFDSLNPQNQFSSEPSELSGYDGGVPSETSYLLVRTADDLNLVVNAVAESRLVGLDCETTGLDSRADRLRLLSLDCETVDGGRFTYLVDAFAVDPEPLWVPLAEAELVAHNAAFDLGFLTRRGFEPGRVHDSLLRSQVLYASARTRGVSPLRHGLKDCCRRELGIELAKDLQSSDWTGELSAEQLTYAATDASALVPLYRALADKLKAAGLERVAALESAALRCVVWLGRSGVPFDRDGWRALAAVAKADADRVTAELNAAAPARPDTLFAEPWNWDSPEQVLRALELAGCPVDSTGDWVLAAIDHPLARLLRDHRDARKRQTTYGEAWLSHVAVDGRVYPRWVQLGANSGRMACGSPSIQNLPRGEYRKCVAAPRGRVLIKADYSQIELRIAAKISGDQALMAAYDRGDDLHVLTARQVLGIAEVTKQHRQLAKAINFGLLYGMGAKSFRSYARTNYGVEMTEAEAQAYREAFFRAYPGLRRWHRSIKDGATDTRTLTSRRVCGVEHFTEKLNLPVQGTGADGLKAALSLLWDRRQQVPGAFPVLAVHDEIVVECDQPQVMSVSDWLKKAMLDGMTPLVAPVPVEVEVKVGRTWGVD